MKQMNANSFCKEGTHFPEVVQAKIYRKTILFKLRCLNCKKIEQGKIIGNQETKIEIKINVEHNGECVQL